MDGYMFDKKLTPAAKEVMAYLLKICDSTKETKATNGEIGEVVNKTFVTVSNAVGLLEREGYISTEKVYQKRRIVVLKEE